MAMKRDDLSTVAERDDVHIARGRDRPSRRIRYEKLIDFAVLSNTYGERLDCSKCDGVAAVE
jgi:hypothetical protein